MTTAVTIMGSPWSLLDYGDTIPSTTDGTMGEVFNDTLCERNQCLSIHLAAGWSVALLAAIRHRQRDWRTPMPDRYDWNNIARQKNAAGRPARPPSTTH